MSATKKRTKCCVKGCKRGVALFQLEHENPATDGWAIINSFSNPLMVMCPVHRLCLEETGTLTDTAEVYAAGMEREACARSCESLLTVPMASPDFIEGVKRCVVRIRVGTMTTPVDGRSR